MRQPEEITLPVRGGRLAALRWPGDGPVVLAVHGITANAACWAVVADCLDGAVTLVAPDLRGRAHSNALPGPYGVAGHAEDLTAVLDGLGVERTVVVGHSMGAYVAAVTADRHPERVRELVLVDGGVSFPSPPDVDIDAAIEAVIGPAMQRLTMTFPSREAYRDFFRQHPALKEDWSPTIETYVDRDLVGEPPELHSSCVLDAVRTDGTDVLRDDDTVTAVHRQPHPATLLWARRGLLDEPQGLYDEDRLRAAGLPGGRVEVMPAEDVNHYTVILAERGARRVADLIRAAVS